MKKREPRSTRAKGLLVQGIGIAVSAVLIAGCGSSSRGNPNATAASVTQAISISYASSASDVPRSYKLDIGRLVYITVKSDTAGEVSIPSFQTAQRIKAGGSTVLVISPNFPGDFPVYLRVGTVNKRFAVLSVPSS